MTSPNSTEEFYCRKCRMKFDTKLKLGNHLNKFCVDSIYGEPRKLLKQLKLEQQESRNSSHLSFGEVQQYLQNDKNNNIGKYRVGKLSLSDLRTKFETHVDQDLEGLKAEIIKRREKELIDQLKDLKQRENQLILSRKKNETLLSEKLDIFNKHKQHEMKTRLETERIKGIIKKADKRDLMTINEEKKKEIQELREAKAALQKQEDAAFNEISQLTLKIQQEEDTFNHKKEQLFKIKNKKGSKFAEITAKIMDNAHKHGTYSAQLQIERDNLQNTKSTLEKQLNNKQLNGMDTQLILNNVQQKLDQQIHSIQTLKKRFDDDNVEMKKQMDIHDTLFQKLSTNPECVDLDDYFDTKQLLTQTEMAHKKEIKNDIQKQRIIDDKPQKQSEQQQHPKSFHKEDAEPQRVTATKPQHELEKPEQKPVQNSTTDPVTMHVPPQTQNVKVPQTESRIPQHPHYPHYPHYSPYAPYPSYPPPMHYMPQYSQPHHPYMMPPYTMQSQWNPYKTMHGTASNPILDQMNQQFEVTQKLLKQNELENELLQNKIKNMQQTQRNDKTKASQKELQNILQLKSKRINTNAISGTDLSTTDDPTTSINKRHSVFGELDDFEKEERRLFSLISTFSEETELKQLYMKQLQSITSGKFELEQMYQEKKIKKLKHEISSYEEQLIAETQHEHWIKAQRRLLERNKMEKELAAQGLVNRTTTTSEHRQWEKIEHKLIPYNNTGITICFDFIIGFTQSFKQCRLVSSIVDGAGINCNTLETSAWDEIYERNNDKNDEYISMIQVTKYIQLQNTDCANAKLLIDVQVKDENNNESHFVWIMIMPLFIESTDKDNTWLIPQGCWKIPLLTPPMDIKATPQSIHQITKSNSVLYFRIIPGCNHTPNDANTKDMDEYVVYKPLSLIDSIIRVTTPLTDRAGTTTAISRTEEYKDNEQLATSRSATSIKGCDDSMSAASFRSTQLYDAQNGVGVLVKFLEHQSKFPFAKLRVSLYDKNNIALDSFGNSTVWETDYAQEGISSLGVYEWEQRHIFHNFPYLTECVVVLEIFESKDPHIAFIDDNKDLSRPLTSHSSRSLSILSTHKLDENENDKPSLWTKARIFRIDEMTNKPLILCGLHELNLYKYPIDFINASLFDQESTLCINIFDPENEPIIKNDVVLLSNNALLNGLDTIQEISDRPWIRVEHKRNSTNIFDEGDGIDLYVDSARFLPSNTTITKLYVQLVWAEVDETTNEQIRLHKDDAPEFTYCDPAESVYNPVFNFRHEYRKDKLHKNSIFIFRVDTIEQFSGQCQILGYSAISLFVDGNDKYLNEGSFQLSLYRVPFEALSLTSFPQKERLPCSTLLVRLAKAPRSDDGTTVLGLDNVDEAEWNKYNIIIAAPNYGDGVYDTALCEPSVQELRLYNSLMNTRNDKQISLILEEQFKNEIDIDLDDEIDEDEFNKWCDVKLKPPPKSKIEFIDLSHFTPYNHNMGIAISIDGINNIRQSKESKDSLYIVIYTISPPFSFYNNEKDFKITDNIKINLNLDVESLSTSPRFIFDKLQTFKDADFEFNQNAILFTDIREIRFKCNDGVHISDLQIINYGFSFFPLFRDNGKYCRSGSFQNIVFRYPENEQNMLSVLNKIVQTGSEQIIKTECALTKQQIKSKILKPAHGCASIFVRIYDNQRSSVGIEDAMTNIDNNLILNPLRSDYVYNPNKAAQKKKSWIFGKSHTTLKSLLINRNITDHKSIIKKLTAAIAQKLDITHYNF